MKLIVAGCALSAAVSFGCASPRYTILSVPAVSMTTPSLPAGTNATAAGRVEEHFCPGDAPVVSQDSNVGLIDEAIAKAQKKSGAVYLSDVTIQHGGGCVYVEGMAMK
jgi:hypothetical protein